MFISRTRILVVVAAAAIGLILFAAFVVSRLLATRTLERKRDRRVQDFREVLEVLSRVGEIECPPIEPPVRSSQPPSGDEAADGDAPELAPGMPEREIPMPREL